MRWDALASKLTARAALARQIADNSAHHACRMFWRASDAALMDVAREVWADYARRCAREAGELDGQAARLEAVANRVVDHAAARRGRRLEASGYLCPDH